VSDESEPEAAPDEHAPEPEPGQEAVGEVTGEVPAPPSEVTEPSFFAPSPALEPADVGSAAPPGEATVPAFYPTTPVSAYEVTDPAYFPPSGARPMEGRDAVTLAGGPPSVAMRIPVPTSVAELFETLPIRFRADRAAGWNARFHFRFKDVERSDWTVVIEDGFCRAFAGHEGAADCVVTTTEKTYLAIEGGLQAPETAFLLGKVKVSNIAAMTRFGKLFRKVAP
jgi:putative sterol carrier protein